MKMITFSIVAIFLSESCTTDKFDKLIEQDLGTNTNKSKSMDETPLLVHYLKKKTQLQKRDFTSRVVKYEILDLETGNKTISYSCLQPGSNCVIRSGSTSNFENEVLDTFMQSFPNIDIQNAVRDNKYAICKNGLDFELRIFNSDHVVSSQLYLSSQL